MNNGVTAAFLAVGMSIGSVASAAFLDVTPSDDLAVSRSGATSIPGLPLSEPQADATGQPTGNAGRRSNMTTPAEFFAFNFASGDLGSILADGIWSLDLYEFGAARDGFFATRPDFGGTALVISWE